MCWCVHVLHACACMCMYVDVCGCMWMYVYVPEGMYYINSAFCNFEQPGWLGGTQYLLWLWRWVLKSQNSQSSFAVISEVFFESLFLSPGWSRADHIHQIQAHTGTYMHIHAHIIFIHVHTCRYLQYTQICACMWCRLPASIEFIPSMCVSIFMYLSVCICMCMYEGMCMYFFTLALLTYMHIHTIHTHSNIPAHSECHSVVCIFLRYLHIWTPLLDIVAHSYR